MDAIGERNEVQETLLLQRDHHDHHLLYQQDLSLTLFLDIGPGHDQHRRLSKKYGWYHACDLDRIMSYAGLLQRHVDEQDAPGHLLLPQEEETC